MDENKIVNVDEIIKKKKGRPAKIYTNEEIMAKINHNLKYQRDYHKKIYVSKKQDKPKCLNHFIAKKYNLKIDDTLNIIDEILN
jgi:hypothetical protein